MTQPRRGSSPERGAVVVEFALVASIFFTLLFGVIQYGLYFSDALSLRQAVRDVARQGVVKSFPVCGAASTDGARLLCQTKEQIGALTGTTYVRAVAPEGWAKGRRLVVCAQMVSDGGVGLVPMPSGGLIRSKTQMSIEKAGAPSGLPAGDTLPAGMSWSWCP